MSFEVSRMSFSRTPRLLSLDFEAFEFRSLEKFRPKTSLWYSGWIGIGSICTSLK